MLPLIFIWFDQCTGIPLKWNSCEVIYSFYMIEYIAHSFFRRNGIYFGGDLPLKWLDFINKWPKQFCLALQMKIVAGGNQIKTITEHILSLVVKCLAGYNFSPPRDRLSSPRLSQTHMLLTRIAQKKQMNTTEYTKNTHTLYPESIRSGNNCH